MLIFFVLWPLLHICPSPALIFLLFPYSIHFKAFPNLARESKASSSDSCADCKALPGKQCLWLWALNKSDLILIWNKLCRPANHPEFCVEYAYDAAPASCLPVLPRAPLRWRYTWLLIDHKTIFDWSNENIVHWSRGRDIMERPS